VPKDGLALFAHCEDSLRARTHYNYLVDNERKSETRIAISRGEP